MLQRTRAFFLKKMHDRTIAYVDHGGNIHIMQRQYRRPSEAVVFPSKQRCAYRTLGSTLQNIERTGE